jgi:hypothetical protein
MLRQAWGPGMTIDVSYFSLASLISLALFLAIIIPRAVAHVANLLAGRLTGRAVRADRWLVAITVAILFCIGFGVAGVLSQQARDLANSSEAVALSFLLFATPAVLQVLRAFAHRRMKTISLFSQVLVVLAVISLPASMAIPTAAVLQATAAPVGQPGGARADNPAAALADSHYFTDSEAVNDPDDYPIATFLARNASWSGTVPRLQGVRHQHFYRQIPIFTSFWLDQTTDVLSFEATDAFGVLVSPITHVRANWAMALAVLLYKTLCAVVLVALTFDPLWAPLGSAIQRTFHRRAS